MTPKVETRKVETRADTAHVQIGDGVVVIGRWPDPEPYQDFIFSFAEWCAFVADIDTEIARQLQGGEGDDEQC
ncbi:MAG: hypothetical protein H6641_15760 [Caldilineaceae bacterium]|nr:hypothetical protein [Caldilineaceae bacterium]